MVVCEKCQKDLPCDFGIVTCPHCGHMQLVGIELPNTEESLNSGELSVESLQETPPSENSPDFPQANREENGYPLFPEESSTLGEKENFEGIGPNEDFHQVGKSIGLFLNDKEEKNQEFALTQSFSSEEIIFDLPGKNNGEDQDRMEGVVSGDPDLDKGLDIPVTEIESEALGQGLITETETPSGDGGAADFSEDFTVAKEGYPFDLKICELEFGVHKKALIGLFQTLGISDYEWDPQDQTLVLRSISALQTTWILREIEDFGLPYHLEPHRPRET